MNKTQHFQMQMKSVEVKEGIIKIKGFASTPDVDRYNDIVDPKAFKSSIEQYMKNPVILLQHDHDKPIGKCIDYKISKKGLFIECEISNDIDNVFKLISDGILRTFSIGFIPKRWEFVETGEQEIRVIKDLDLIENSVVTTPANGQAVFTLSKSIKSFFENLKDNQETMDKDIKMTAEEIIEAPVVELEGEELEKAQEETEAHDAEAESAEVSDETTQEVVDEEKDVELDGTNPEVLEEVESEGERPSGTETEEEVAQVAPETTETEEEVNDQTNEEKSFFDTKAVMAELSEIKSTVSTISAENAELKETNKDLIEAMELIAKEYSAMKSIISKIPMKKGLATMGGLKQESKLGSMLSDAKNNII